MPVRDEISRRRFPDWLLDATSQGSENMRLSLPLSGLMVLVTAWGTHTQTLEAQLVPGTGTLLNTDDFEDENWAFQFAFPKSSKEEDEQIRYPLGRSNNGKWFESPKRGTPDVVRRVETPAGGLAGSTGALYLRSRDTGIPGRPGMKQAQDDFILQARPLSVSYSPSAVVRVYLPPWEQWEQRTGVTFGMRCGLQGPQTKEKEANLARRLFRRQKTQVVTEIEPFYPGFFIQYNCKNDPNSNYTVDHAVFIIRAGNDGRDIVGPKIMQTGWWTLGMSVTPDARVHYYASPGIDDLTAKDHIVSTTPHGIPAKYFNTIFFNVCSADNGQSWSTPWIIDDPKVFHLNGAAPGIASGHRSLRR